MSALREESYDRKHGTEFRKLQNQFLSKEKKKKKKRQSQGLSSDFKKWLALGKYHGFLF